MTPRTAWRPAPAFPQVEPEPRRRITRAERTRMTQQAQEMRRRGVTLQVIADTLGVSLATAYRFVHQGEE